MLQGQLNQLLDWEAPASTTPEASRAPGNGRRKRRKLSAQGIANIRAGVAKQMAKKAGGATQAAAAGDGGAAEPRRHMSPAAKARLSAIAKARWKKARAAGKIRL